MKRSQANRSVVAARASASTPNLAAHTLKHTLPKGAAGAIRRSRALKLTATQKNSEGRTSEWSMSPEFFTDPKWGKTVRECE